MGQLGDGCAVEKRVLRCAQDDKSIRRDDESGKRDDESGERDHESGKRDGRSRKRDDESKRGIVTGDECDV